MKLIDSEGTNKENFSIGLGEKKVDLKSINGELYFKDFGGGYEKVASASTNNAAVPRSWTANTLYRAKELIAFGNALWISREQHASGASFFNSIDKLRKINDVDNFTVIDTNFSSSTTVSVFNSQHIYIFGGSDAHSVSLPAANSLPVGTSYFLENDSSATISVFSNGSPSALLKKITPGSSASFTLLSNSTASGTWSNFDVFNNNALKLSIKINSPPGSLFSGAIVYLDENGNWQFLDYEAQIENFAFFTTARIGIVIDAQINSYEILLRGEFITSSTLVANTDYFLSKTIAGNFSSSESDLFLFRTSTATRAYFSPYYFQRTNYLKTYIPQANAFLPGAPLNFNGTWSLATFSTKALGIVLKREASFFVLSSGGNVSLTTNEWDAVVAGQTGGLTPGAKYYLSSTPGQYTTTRPSGTFFVVFVALSSTSAQLVLKDENSGISLTEEISEDANAVPFTIIKANTVLAPITITLPLSPSDNDRIGFLDAKRTFHVNPLTVDRNGRNINGIAENWSLDIKGVYVEIVYVASENSWFFVQSPRN